MGSMKTGIVILLSILVNLVNYVIITTIVDSILMGALHLHFSTKCRKKEIVITKANRIDLQDGYQCSAFSSAYILRHWDIEAHGDHLYEVIPNKMKDGCVYPKGILNLLSRYGFKAKYCAGNIAALKNEVSKGNPVIVMIRGPADKNWLHYVPVVGYDEQSIFIAESLADFVNSDEQYYNRKISVKEFQRLWNTSMLKMPFYRNTYITISEPTHTERSLNRCHPKTAPENRT